MKRITLARIVLSIVPSIVACSHRGAAPPGAPPAPAPAAAPSAAPPAGARTLAADEQVTTASGAQFTASSGWTIDARPDRIELRAPEGDVRWFHVELAAADRDAAVAAAWQRAVPGFALAVEVASDSPPRDGWDAMSMITYAAPPPRAVLAFARRRGETWYLDLIDATIASLDRRAAQLRIGIDSLRVAGAEEESFAGKTARVDDQLAPKLDAFVRDAMAQANTPGMAIAVVHRGKVVLARGWGVRELGKPAPVTPDTRFMIGSVTKPLTSLLMARLVDANKLRWDTPVTSLLPEFALGDPEMTRAMTMRHTVCACTGLPRRDLELIFDGEATPEQRIAAMRTQRPTTKIGETFQYSNMMVAIGGYAAARAYDRNAAVRTAHMRAMRELVFRPLGMTRTTFDLAEAARAEHASPHPRDLDGKPIAQPAASELFTAPLAPAGSAWSTATDMARVLLLELGDGELDGARLVSRDALHARRAPQIKAGANASYGLALVNERRNGIDVLWHSGATAGFSSLLFFVPEHQLGAVILTNVSSTRGFNESIRRRLLELVFDGRDQAAAQLAAKLAEQRAERAALTARITDRDPAWATPLLGRWRAPGLGEIELRRERGRLILDSGQWQTVLAGAKTTAGEPALIATVDPITGFELEVRGDTLVSVSAGQESVVFERVRGRP